MLATGVGEAKWSKGKGMIHWPTLCDRVLGTDPVERRKMADAILIRVEEGRPSDSFVQMVEKMFEGLTTEMKNEFLKPFREEPLDGRRLR